MMRGTNEEKRWNVLWQQLQSRVGKVELVPSLWYGLALITVTALYFGSGRLGLSLGAVSGFAALIWLPSGLSVAALFLWGFRLWPAVTLGAFFVNLFTGAPWPVAVGISIGNTLEAVVTTALLKREKVRPNLESQYDVLVLALLAAPIGATISATVGVGSLWVGRVIVWPSVFATWGAWWLGDMISLLLLTPLLLTWSTLPQGRTSHKRLLELGIISMLVLGVGLYVFLGALHAAQKGYTITYLVFPPLIWAALRFGPRGATGALAVLSGIAVVGTVEDNSPFSSRDLSTELLSLQFFMGTTAVTILMMAAVMTERNILEQRKDEFIGMASHELRTPLTSLQGYAQLLHRQLAGMEQPRTLHALTTMETQIRRISQLITDLLDLSKIQTGKLTFREEAVDVDALVREVVEQLQQTSTRHKLVIDGSAPGIISGDRERLGQVLSNLLTNAIKYSPQAEQVIVRLAATREGLTVGVQDFGIGIPKGELERVFEQFYRIAKHERTATGLGIGLSIAYKIIEHHGGRLWVESVEGRGSTFSFWLPWQ